MYLFEYRFFSCLQEPKNRYKITWYIFLSNQELEPILVKYQRLGLIRKVENDPNKFMNTIKGERVLYLIRELNKLLEKYVTLEL